MPVAKPGVVIPPSAPASGAGAAREEQLEYATLLYSYENYDLAIRQYLQYLADHPDHPSAQEAWYRLGESYLHQKDIKQAEECYRNQLRNFPKGEYVPAAAYRLATLTYNRQDYKTAATNFLIAEARSTEREIKLSAAFYKARSLQALGKLEDAAKAYQALGDSKEKENPYREASLLYLARIASQREKPEEALQRFTALAKDAQTSSIKAEALFKTGLLTSEKGDHAQAAEFFEKALAIEGAETWRPLAYYGAVRSLYEAEKYDAVVAAYKEDLRDLPEESRANLLLMVGNAHRHQQEFPKAIEIYSIIEKYFAESPEGQEAGYRKLLCFHDFKDPSLPDYVDYYVEQQRTVDPELVYLDMALMLKAETLFARGEYARASAAYAQVRPENIASELRPTLLYKWGWSLSESGDPARAVEVLTEFLLLNPSDPKAASALAQRASSYKSLQDTNAALVDLAKITSEFPQSDAAEFAHQQSALIHGQSRRMAEMIHSFEALLKDFPDTKGAAEANYWIGYGKFELQDHKAALKPLDNARELDAGTYHERATLRIILAHYHLKDSKNLLKEVNFFLNTKPESEIHPQVLSWLGSELFKQEDYSDAERFLAMASTPAEPSKTAPEIWNYLGKARIQTGFHQGAVEALDHYLASQTKPSSRAKALLDKSLAQLGLKSYSEAAATATEALSLEKQGRVNALIRMQLGDIAMEEQKFEEGAREYIVISQIFLDPEITPLAMQKAAHALRKAGDNEKAGELEAELKAKFPNYKVAKP